MSVSEPTNPRPAFADALARELGEKRVGGLDMSGKHNPLPSEVRWANRFLEDFESALAAADAVISPPANYEQALHEVRERFPTLNRILCTAGYDGKAVQAEAWEAFQEMASARAAVLSPPPSALFADGEFTSHAGLQLSYKVDCDALTDEDIATIAAELARRLPPFNFVYGVRGGGERLALALKSYMTVDEPADEIPMLIVDDVMTTGTSMEGARNHFMQTGHQSIGAVIFARGPVPPWVTALFVETRRVSPSEATTETYENAIARIRGVVHLCYPDDMTPFAKRALDATLDELAGVVRDAD